MTLKVSKLYLGCIELRDYNVKDAIRNEEPIVVEYQGERMTLSPEDLKNKVMSESPLMTSKIGKEDYHLLGYRWIPDEI